LLCRTDIAALWACRDDRFRRFSAVAARPRSTGNPRSFLGEVQSAYPKKELELADCLPFNCARLHRLTTPPYVETASAWNWHRFHWLAGDHEIRCASHRLEHLGVRAGPGAGEGSEQTVPICCIGPSRPLVPPGPPAMGGHWPGPEWFEAATTPGPVGLSGKCSAATQRWLVSTAGSASPAEA